MAGERETGRTVVVDVREQLRAGKEPFLDIMQAADRCQVGDTLVLYATFKPVPLLAVMEGQGFQGQAHQLPDKDWRVDFLRVAPAPAKGGGSGPATAPPEAPQVEKAEATADVYLDNRGLEPPEPMVRTLETLLTVAPGQRLVAKYDRTPMFLLPKLDEMGYGYQIKSLEQGQAQLTITPPAPSANAADDDGGG